LRSILEKHTWLLPPLKQSPRGNRAGDSLSHHNPDQGANRILAPSTNPKVAHS